MTAAAVLAAAHVLDPEGAALLDPALDPIRESVWPDIAWSFSSLTADGCPVDLGFSSHDRMLRATLEVAGPECPAHERLDAGLRLLDRLGLPRPAETVVAEWRALQSGLSLDWGCWLGLRKTASGPRGKLYLQIPHHHASYVPGTVGHMFGHEPAAGLTEYYGRPWPATEPLLHHVLGSSSRLILDTMTDLVDMSLASALRRVELCVSIATGPAIATRYALFFKSHAVAGGAGRIRALFAGNTGYRALFANVPDHELPDHGVLTLTPDDRGGVEFRAAVSATGLPGIC